MYVTDLDKTLLRSDLTLSSYTISVLNSLTQAGVLLTYATARAPGKAKDLMRELEIVLPIIVFNGALVVDHKGEVLIANVLDPALVRDLIARSRERGLLPFILGTEEKADVFLYGDMQNEGQRLFVGQRLGDKRMKFSERLMPLETTLLLNFIGEEEELRELRGAIRVWYGSEVETKLARDPYCREYFSLEVLHRKADKAIALHQLAEFIGVDLLEVTVFGDHLNDLGMFNIAGTAIAVGNSETEVKAIADLVIGTNDEDGVARYFAEKHLYNLSH